MLLQERYQWEALKADGTTITEGADLTDCVRLKLLPQVEGLPLHAVAGVPMVRRFCRGFLTAGVSSTGEAGQVDGGYTEYLHCIVCSTFRLYVFSTNGQAVVTPPELELYI
jgi:hypothetical protein